MEPATDRACPECGDRISIDARACACGWRKNATKRVDTGSNLDCQWNDHGHICGQRGCMSDSMNGSGPWYCSPHYALLKKWALKSNGPRVSYRERWYEERGLPYEPPKAGNAQELIPKRSAA